MSMVPVIAKPNCLPLKENPAPTQPIPTQKMPKSPISRYPTNDSEANSDKPIRAKNRVAREARIVAMPPILLRVAIV